MALESLQKERLKKLDNIQKLGINPYPASLKTPAGKPAHRTPTRDAKKMMGEEVLVAGRIRSFRPHGKITFADIEDATGKIQLFFSQNDIAGEKYDFLANLDLGDFIQVTGEIIKTQAGEITVKVSSYQLLTKSLRPLPSNWYGLKDTEEKLRKRYLDLLINPEVREMFELKSRFWANIRKFMTDHGFLEVEITDSGCGIPDDAVGKIFDPLYTTKAKGIGLGLAVSKTIIERHEGSIEVKSEVGKGTTFTMKLPLKAKKDM